MQLIFLKLVNSEQCERKKNSNLFLQPDMHLSSICIISTFSIGAYKVKEIQKVNEFFQVQVSTKRIIAHFSQTRQNSEDRESALKSTPNWQTYNYSKNSPVKYKKLHYGFMICFPSPSQTQHSDHCSFCKLAESLHSELERDFFNKHV